MFMVTITTRFGTYLKATPNDRRLEHQPSNTDILAHLFHLDFLTASIITLKSTYDTYISARKHYQICLTTDHNPKYWERFELEIPFDRQPNKIALRTAHGTYLSANENGVIVQVEESEQEPEYFELCFFPILLRTSHNTYIGSRLQQTGLERSDIFIPELHDGKIALRTSNNAYISARDDGSISLVPQCLICEQFIVRQCSRPMVYFRTCFQTILSAENRGGLVQADLINKNEKFEIIPAEITKGAFMMGFEL
jgi:hypothetical protein